MAEEVTPVVADGGEQGGAQAPEAPQLTPDAGGDQGAQTTEPTPEELAESKEWEDAGKDLLAEKGPVTKEEKTDEQTKPGEGAKTEEEGGEKKTPAEADGENKDGADAIKQSPEEATRAAEARAARSATRQATQQVETIKSEVREQMFKDVPTELRDAEGDPINTVEDVMKLKDPRTGEAFTEEAAGVWLIAAQQEFNKKQAAIDKQIDSIADVNMQIADEADAIKEKYGEFLGKKENASIRDRLYAQWEKTLVKDKDSDVITQMPVSLEEFYDIALAPYVEKEQQSAADVQAQAQAEAERKRQEAEQRQRTRSDRSDIYGGAGDDKNADPEDDEWGAAQEAVYGKKITRS